MVRPQPSKLMMRVRFPPPAPYKEQAFAHIAQSVEHFLGKEEVTGSNPVMSSTFEGFRDFIGLVESSEVIKKVYQSSLVVIVCIGGNHPLSIVEK